VKRKALSSLLILWLAASTLTIIITEQTKASPQPPEIVPMKHGYLRSDGTIDPPTLPIQLSRNVYVLTDNIVNYTIEIQKDNAVIDGNGFSLTIPPYDELDEFSTPISKIGAPSINISSRNNIIVKNIKFDNCFFCIWVENSSNSIITQNTMANGNLGVYMNSSVNCDIIGNEVTSTGLKIEESTLLNMAYNNISRNHNYGAQLSVTSSNISRNDFVDNFDAGLYFLSPNVNNRVFENNFVNNEVGLLFRDESGTNVNNSVFSNYWSGNNATVNIYKNGVSYIENDVDESPLSSPASTSFDPSTYPWPSFTSNDSSFSPTAFTIAVSGASLVIVCIGLLFYFKKRRR
jgi:parallel beta-helix repeat protein